MIPEEDWCEVPASELEQHQTERDGQRHHVPVSRAASEVDLEAIKPGAPMPRSRLKTTPIPATQVAAAFVSIGIVVLGMLIVAALLARL